FSVILSLSEVISSPEQILVARQAYAGLSAVNSPALPDSLLISFLQMPASLRGERTPSSLSTLIPGLSSSGSDALVPSATTWQPSLAASFAMADNIFFLQ